MFPLRNQILYPFSILLHLNSSSSPFIIINHLFFSWGPLSTAVKLFSNFRIYFFLVTIIFYIICYYSCISFSDLSLFFVLVSSKGENFNMFVEDILFLLLVIIYRLMTRQSVPYPLFRPERASVSPPDFLRGLQRLHGVSQGSWAGVPGQGGALGTLDKLPLCLQGWTWNWECHVSRRRSGNSSSPAGESQGDCPEPRP